MFPQTFPGKSLKTTECNITSTVVYRYTTISATETERNTYGSESDS